MKFNNKKKAFTIAEIMVVLLILTIIFAAFAPLMTKRRLMSTSNRYMVWTWGSGSYSQGLWMHIIIPETQIIPVRHFSG